MYYPREVIDEVRMGNDIVDVIGSYVNLKRSGSSYVGLCPFHKEKTPSFHVNRDNQFYYCFGCGAKGNVYSFLMQHQNYSFQDAVKYLAERINYTLPEASYSPDYEYKKQLRQKLYDIHNSAAKFYYEKLNSPEGSNAVRYLDQRQIKKSARITFGLGYAPIATSALYERLLSEGYDEEIILQSGLVTRRNDGSVKDKFFNRLMFPIINVYGNIIGFGGRVIGQGEPKYLNSPETEIFNKSKNLYSLNFARLSKKKELILVEGYMDVISVYQAGFHNVVAALGTAFNENHAKTLKAYADSVILLFDSDAAGVKAVLRAIPVLNNAGIKVKVLQVTDAKDPDEYIKKFGSTAFGKLLERSKSQYTFRIECMAKDYDLSKSDEKIAYTNEIAKILSTIDNAIEADVYIKDAAAITGISQEAIRSVISSINGESVAVTKPPVVHNKTAGTNKGTDDARKGLISIMVGNPAICGMLRNILNPEEFVDEFYITMVKAIYELVDAGKPVIAANIVGYYETVEDQQRATELFVLQMTYNNTEDLQKAVSDQLIKVKGAYIDKKIEAAMAAANTAEVAELVRDKRNINNLNIRF